MVTQSYERIHRSNLVDICVLPLLFESGEKAEGMGLDGSEPFTSISISDIPPPQADGYL